MGFAWAGRIERMTMSLYYADQFGDTPLESGFNDQMVNAGLAWLLSART